MGSRDLDSGPYAGLLDTSPEEPSPQPSKAIITSFVYSFCREGAGGAKAHMWQSEGTHRIQLSPSVIGPGDQDQVISFGDTCL